MKPTYVSIAMLVVCLFLAPTVWAQAPASTGQNARSLAPTASVAEVPRLIKFSGTLLDAQERSMSGPVGVTFALYAQQTGGAALWLETQNVKPDGNGNYTVLLGANSANGVPAELFVSGEARWLGIQVGQQPEHERILLVSVPYALKAGDAETLGGLPASAFVTTGTPGNTGNAGGAAAATSSSSTGLPKSSAATTPKTAATTPQPATPCSSVTSDGTATANSITLFTAPCNIQSSVITQSSGNVGFGTATPAVAVDVVANNAGLRLSGTGTHQVTVTGATSGRLGQDATGFFFSSDTNGKVIKFLTNNGALNEWMRITSAGNVGIGTTTPSAKLDVAGTGNFTGNITASSFTGNLTGNATTATNFSGSLAGEVTGTQGATVVTNAVSPNTANAIVRRDASGNFSAGTITANLNGNAITATTAMNFSGSLAGEVTGTQGATVVSNAVTADTANAIVRRDGSGNFSAGTVTLAGNLALPSTTSISVGVVTMGGPRFLHNFGTQNTFLGEAAGNMSLTGDHNTGVGGSALFGNTSGGFNAAFGTQALQSNTTGSQNAAFGHATLFANTRGTGNSAFGYGALMGNSIGINNSVFGDQALPTNSAGMNNSAFGVTALQGLSSGNSNIAIGAGAGSIVAAGSNNIYIGNLGGATTESNTIRIGSGQMVTFIAGINGATSASGVAVLVNSSGQLGTTTSSRRFKHEIADMGAESDLLMKLRPVAFYYKTELDETHTRQYGLVAEEVAQVAPQLVVFDKEGAPQTVRYHFVNAMLLNEVQKQRQMIEEHQRVNEKQRQLAEEQQSTIVRQQVEIENLAARVAKLEALVALARLGR